MKVALIDADHIIYIACHNKKKYDSLGKVLIDDWGREVTENKSLDDCKACVDDYIDNIMKSLEATHYILALTIGKCFRYDIYPEYKANRKKLEKPSYFIEIRDYLTTKYQALSWPLAEADDIVNTIKVANPSYHLVSTDKDMLNLYSREAYHINPTKDKVAYIVDEDFAYRYFWLSMIIGDTSDNIKGIEGKGEVFAEKLLSKDALGGYRTKVLDAYVTRYGEEEGINNFYKNYSCLKIKDKLEGFEQPNPIEYKFNVNKKENNTGVQTWRE